MPLSHLQYMLNSLSRPIRVTHLHQRRRNFCHGINTNSGRFALVNCSDSTLGNSPRFIRVTHQHKHSRQLNKCFYTPSEPLSLLSFLQCTLSNLSRPIKVTHPHQRLGYTRQNKSTHPRLLDQPNNNESLINPSDLGHDTRHICQTM